MPNPKGGEETKPPLFHPRRLQPKAISLLRTCNASPPSAGMHGKAETPPPYRTKHDVHVGKDNVHATDHLNRLRLITVVRFTILCETPLSTTVRPQLLPSKDIRTSDFETSTCWRKKSSLLRRLETAALKKRLFSSLDVSIRKSRLEKPSLQSTVTYAIHQCP